MWTEEQFIELEQDEREITDDAILVMLLLLADTKRNLEKELRAFYQKYGDDGVVTYAEARKWISEQNHSRRLTNLLLVISSAFVSVLPNLETHFRNFLTEVIAKESTFFGVPVDVDKILSRNWGADDLYWLIRLENNVSAWRLYIANDVKQAIHQGKTIDDVLKRLDKRFSSINKALENLGLSESTAIGSFSRNDIFKELGVSKYQFYSMLDERRCETCGAMHGHIFPISAYEVGVTASPLHPRCRCWEVPLLD